MPRDRLWTPTLHCVRCGRLAIRDALRAWVFQPITPDGGRVHFECRRCRPAHQRMRNPSVRRSPRQSPSSGPDRD